MKIKLIILVIAVLIGCQKSVINKKTTGAENLALKLENNKCVIPTFEAEKLTTIYFPKEFFNWKEWKTNSYIVYAGKKIEIYDISKDCEGTFLYNTTDIYKNFPQKCFFLLSEYDYSGESLCSDSNNDATFLCSNKKCFKFVCPDLYDQENGKPLFDEETGIPLGSCLGE